MIRVSYKRISKIRGAESLLDKNVEKNIMCLRKTNETKEGLGYDTHDRNDLKVMGTHSTRKLFR